MTPHAYIITDGSASGGGVGAWATVIALTNNDDRHLRYGIGSHTTIGRCELEPIIDGLRWAYDNLGPRRGIRLTIISDSEQIVRTIGGEFEASKNLDLWERYNFLAAGFDIRAIWRERNSHPYMRVVDAVCYALRKKQLTIDEKLGKNIEVLSLEGLDND